MTTLPPKPTASIASEVVLPAPAKSIITSRFLSAKSKILADTSFAPKDKANCCASFFLVATYTSQPFTTAILTATCPNPPTPMIPTFIPAFTPPVTTTAW